LEEFSKTHSNNEKTTTVFSCRMSQDSPHSVLPPQKASMTVSQESVFTYSEKSINTSHGFPTGSTVTFITCVKVCDDSY